MLKVMRLSSVVPTSIDELQFDLPDSDANDSFPGCDADPDVDEDVFDDWDDDDDDDEFADDTDDDDDDLDDDPD